MNWESFLVGFVAFILFVALIILLLRLRLSLGWLYTEILAGITVHIISSIAGFILVQEFSYWYYASLFAFLWFCFFFVTSIYSVSVSVGVIKYLYKEPNYLSSQEDVYQKCIVSSFSERAEFLVKNKLVQKRGMGYLITASGRKTVHYLQLAQKILGMESYGFYTQPSNGLKIKK
jgi:hypothetical protein